MRVTGAPTPELARRLGKAVINSPLFKTAIAGNDPNVGRLLAVVGRVMGTESPETDVSNTRYRAKIQYHSSIYSRQNIQYIIPVVVNVVHEGVEERGKGGL